MKTVRTLIPTFVRSSVMYKPFFLSIITLILCSLLLAACGQQDYSANTYSGTEYSTHNYQTSTNNSTGNSGQNSQTTTNNGTGSIVHNFRCTSGITRGVRVPSYPGALHITFLQATTTANFVQDELTIEADPSYSNVFTWTLRSTGEQRTATITNPAIGAYNFGVTVLGFTQTLSADPDTGQLQQATFWVAEVCDQWATDGAPAE